MKNKNKPAPVVPTPVVVAAPQAPAAPVLDVVGAADASVEAEKNPVASLEVSAPQETYRDHQAKWKSKEEELAEAKEAKKPSTPPRRDVPGKYRKFSN